MALAKDSRVYVGNLPPDVREKEVEDLFWKFGDIKNVTLKNHRGPPFAFVEFDDYRDADDAVKGRSGYNFDGYKLRVERPKSGVATTNNGRAYTVSHGRQSYSQTRRTDHRVVVTGLPPTGSWQDLKDHMREAGSVTYADVYKKGWGVVEYERKNSANYAVRHLDNTKFKSHEGQISYLRVQLYDEARRSRSKSTDKRSTSPGYSRSRSRSYFSRSRERSRSTSASRSP